MYVVRWVEIMLFYSNHNIICHNPGSSFFYLNSIELEQGPINLQMKSEHSIISSPPFIWKNFSSKVLSDVFLTSTSGWVI